MLSQVIDAVFVKMLHHAHAMVPVIMMLQVVQLVNPVKLKLLGLVVLNHVGYVSVIVTSVVSGPLFPYVIVYWISSQL